MLNRVNLIAINARLFQRVWVDEYASFDAWKEPLVLRQSDHQVPCLINFSGKEHTLKHRKAVEMAFRGDPAS
jgi:hypothetical protein